jgi:hypothetical protein
MNRNIKKMELKLLENGIDFINVGIDNLFERVITIREQIFPDYLDDFPKSSFHYKYGVLHLFSGFLLLLKEKLKNENEELIYYKGNKGERTVNFHEAIKNLKTIGFEFSKEDYDLIGEIREKRNQFEHYECEIEPFELYSKLKSFLNIIDKFLYEELREQIEIINEDKENLIHKIHSIDSVWERVEKKEKLRIIDQVNKAKTEFDLDKEANIASLKRMQSRNGQSYFLNCPECGNCESVISHGEFAGICINDDCQETFPTTSCFSCGEVVLGFYWRIKYCDDCDGRMN